MNAPARFIDMSLLPRKVGPSKKTAPIMPEATPRIPFLLIALLKIKAPTTNVKTGVNALRIPESPEGINVPAVENKKAGIALPINPVIKRKK
jgi:hypothetical protein